MAVTVNTAGLISSSGFDVQGLVDQMMTAAQAPEQVWKDQQSNLDAQTSALKGLSSSLGSLNVSVDALSDVLGAFAQRLATSSNTSSVTATASTAAAFGQHTVAVTSLAAKAVYYSTTKVVTADSVLSGGSVTIAIGNKNQQIAIGGDTNTLNKLAAKINGLAMDVSASVVTDSSGAKLALVSNDTGKASDITLTTTADSALTFSKAADGTDAVATIDGVPVSSSSNTISNAVAGLTIQLAAPTQGNPVTITVAADTGRATQAIGSFVGNYNALVTSINAQFTYNEGTGSAGPLAGDAMLRSVQQQLMQATSGVSVSGSALPTLRSLGLTMNDDGTLSIDNATLSSALSSQFSEVQTFFQQPSSGFATRLATLMDSLNDSVKGPFTVELHSIGDTQKNLASNLTDFDDRLALQREQLVAKFSQANAALQQLPTIQYQIDAMLGTSSSSSNNKR